jgi:branched-chain amino acid transport system ATP-binding protein
MAAPSNSHQPVSDVVLETRSLTKAFQGFTAVDGVSLQVRRGEIHALIGPNGAGKTTLFNLLTKFLAPTSGDILLNGRDITRESAARTARNGMVRSFQISAIFPAISVRRNVRLALQSRQPEAYAFWRSSRCLDHLHAATDRLLHQVGLEHLADAVAGDLPYGQRRALELATTLALDPEVLLLDEPTQGMGLEDVGRVTELVASLAGQRTVLMVEHNMGVVSRIAHTISVLQRGRVLASGSYAEVSTNPEVMSAYMGRRQEQPLPGDMA